MLNQNYFFLESTLLADEKRTRHGVFSIEECRKCETIIVHGRNKRFTTGRWKKISVNWVQQSRFRAKRYIGYK